MLRRIFCFVDPNFSKSFSAVFNPIEELYVPMNYAWRIAKNLNYVSSDDDYRTAFQRVRTCDNVKLILQI